MICIYNTAAVTVITRSDPISHLPSSSNNWKRWIFIKKKNAVYVKVVELQYIMFRTVGLYLLFNVRTAECGYQHFSNSFKIIKKNKKIGNYIPILNSIYLWLELEKGFYNLSPPQPPNIYIF